MNLIRTQGFGFPFGAQMVSVIMSRLLGSTCALCGREQAGALCNACCIRVSAYSTQRCPRCAIAISSGHADCARCTSHPPSFDASYCATDYAAPMDVLVHALKFGAKLPLAAAFAKRLMAHIPTAAVADAGLMIAVPLSAQRLAQRGFNQAHEIAKPIARAWRLPLATELCIRVRDTQPQSSLPLSRRRGNMRSAFTVTNPRAVHGQHVLLVDDVMTTGATLDSLAATLKRYGAARVTNLAFARTPAR